MMEDGVDSDLIAMDDVKDAGDIKTGGGAGLHEELSEADRHRGVTLGGLEDEGVADGDGDAEHPHRDHGREVEWRDAGDDSQGLTHGIDVDAGAGAFGILA